MAGKFQFSERERHDLFIAWILVSIAFAIVFKQDVTLGKYNLYQLVALSALTVGVGFLLHELAHKWVAVKYGKYAEFHAAIPLLALAILMSFFGVVFAAPGAVVISGYSSRREMGHIAIAGPLTNLALALVALPFFLWIHSGFWGDLIGYFYTINVWLAVFNMIPLWIFDGAKVLAWNKRAYFVTLIAALILFFVPMALRS